MRTRLSRTSSAPADVTWQAARSVTLAQTRTLGRLVRWRIPGVSLDQTFYEMFRAYPFTPLSEGDHWTVSALCGRIWTFARDYPELSGEQDFFEWDKPGTVKVLFAHWVEVREDGTSELFSEERIVAVDERARARLRSLWRVVGRFKNTVAAEPLPIAVERAEKVAPGTGRRFERR